MLFTQRTCISTVKVIDSRLCGYTSCNPQNGILKMYSLAAGVGRHPYEWYRPIVIDSCCRLKIVLVSTHSQ